MRYGIYISRWEKKRGVVAKVIVTNQEGIAEGWAMWLRTIALGAVIGAIVWLATVLIGRYIIEPMTCGQVVHAAFCSDSRPVAGSIAAILAAVGGVVVMVRMAASRPIVVAIAAAALLWSIAALTDGLFWIEALAWSVVLYALSYALFAWIARYASLLIALVITVVLVVVIRIALVL